MSRDPFFSSMQSNQSPRNNVNNQSNNSFPPIGTFTLESTSPQSNQIFSQQDFFNNSSQSNSSIINGSNGGNNSTGINGSNSTTGSTYNNSNNNSSGGDPNQATRETGIIEKLLVCLIHFFSFKNSNEFNFFFFFKFLSSTLMDSYNAANVKHVCFFIFPNSVETLSI